jgi:hypothetical protein
LGDPGDAAQWPPGKPDRLPHDGGHVALVEQRELQGAALDQAVDRRGAQGSDPIEPGRPQIGLNAGLGGHAAIPDEDDMAQREALFELGDLRRQRPRIGGVTVKHLDCDGATVGGAQQAIDDLQFIRLAVAAVAELGQFAAAAFEPARRDVVEH